jgi:hypothetical protein
MAFEDVAKRMQQRGGPGLGSSLPPGTAPEILMADAARAERRAQSRNDIVFGILLLVIGIGITSFTYSSASQAGGTYVVAYGPIIIGVVKLFRGLIRSGT